MPTQSIWMIRLALIYLLASVSIGALILIHKAVPLHPSIWAFLPLHYEMAIWGWMVQFIMGTAYWIFPKFLTGRRRGPEWVGWIVVILFNLGLVLLLISYTTASGLSGIMKTTGRGVMLFSILTFAGLIWRRLVTYRKH